MAADSAGTHNYHVGNPPDSRAIAAAARFGVDLAGLRARRVQPADLATFDHVIAMDSENLVALERMATATPGARLDLMLRFAPGSGLEDVPDPYYGTERDFDDMCQLLDRATRGLLASLEEQGV